MDKYTSFIALFINKYNNRFLLLLCQFFFIQNKINKLVDGTTVYAALTRSKLKFSQALLLSTL
jgi:hypothetical protein